MKRGRYDEYKEVLNNNAFSVWRDFYNKVVSDSKYTNPNKQYQTMSKITIFLKDNMEIVSKIPDNSFNLTYMDPPFNTGKQQKRKRIKVIQDDNGDRTGFGNKKYKVLNEKDNIYYEDKFDNLVDFLKPRVVELKRILKPDGSFFLHIDQNESHYCKVMLDNIFGKENFMNEIIWSYDFGGRSKKKWASKHDTIFWYVIDKNNYTFNYDEIDRIPYMSPGLVGKEKALKGKTPTDVWWNTIVPTNGKEKTNYPTQKPIKILNRIIKVHSNPLDSVIDIFAGSGTTGEASLIHNRNCVLIDKNPEAIEVMKKRFEKYKSSNTINIINQ